MDTVSIGSRGPYVKLLQSILNRIGYMTGAVDGIFGSGTLQAVLAFQRDAGLETDGIVGPDTWAVLDKYIRGYEIYTVRPGDTVYNIARRHYTNVNAILTANPGTDPQNLMVGQTLVVPYGIDVVLTDIDYMYEIMEMEIDGLKARYPFLEVGIAGTSVLGKNLYYLKLGNGPKEVFYNAAHHSLEWITSPLLMKFAENFLRAYSRNQLLRGYSTANLWQSTSIYIMPMVNPDGVDLVLEGLRPDNPYFNNLLQWNRTGLPFSQVWNANIRGVDLNRNYPASWEEGIEQAISLGITGPGPTRYGGPSPLSEPETQTVSNFTRMHDFRLVLAYHTQGRVIYWDYRDLAPVESLPIAQVFSRVSGYAVSEVPYEASFAGYKDWFIQEYRRPGYTIEAGIGRNPLPISQFPQIYRENEEILLLAALV